jgi:hypothetical protein
MNLSGIQIPSLCLFGKFLIVYCKMVYAVGYALYFAHDLNTGNGKHIVPYPISCLCFFNNLFHDSAPCNNDRV